MKSLNLNGAWPILMIVALFLILPLATLPGFFNLVFLVLIAMSLVIAALIVAALVTSRKS